MDEGSANGFKEYQAAAGAMKIPLQSLEVRGPNHDLDGAFQAATKRRDNALIVVRGPSLRRHAKRIADLAIKNRLPCMCEGSDSVEAGGLMTHSIPRDAVAYFDIFSSRRLTPTDMFFANTA